MSDTIVEWFGLRDGSDCGYCKSKSSKLNHGMWAHRMSCLVYEELLDCGWRRSGSYCYKPVMDKTCCPQYAIRCDTTQVKLTKSQKKVIKRFNKFLINGKTEKSQDAFSIKVADPIESNAEVEVLSPPCLDLNKEIINNESASSKDYKTIKGADPNKPKCRRAKDVRIENKLMKMSKKSFDAIDPLQVSKKQKNAEKSLEHFIDEVSINPLYNLKLRLISVHDDTAFDPLFENEYELFCKYQHIVHGDDIDDLSPQRFRRFLVDGPLKYTDSSKTSVTPSTGFGPFHQLYFLDEKLIAVGVLDILPHCVSSKYFFYDPDYSFLSLGTYSALREIYLTRWLNQECDSIKYYYMGYFIHSCPKMRYKGQYKPSYLLCPETFSWQEIRICLPKLIQKKYSRLEEDNDVIPPPIPDYYTSLLLHKRTVITCKDYIEELSDSKLDKEMSEIKEYVHLVGNVCDHALLYRK